MTVKLLTVQFLEFLTITGGCTGSSESTLVKIPHCWKSHVMVQMSSVLLSTLSPFYILIYMFYEMLQG